MRNRVRLKLIPQLKVYNLTIKEIIHQTILLLTEDASYLELKAEGLLSQAIVSFEENQLRLDLKKLRERPNATPRQKIISEIFSGVER